MKFLANENFPKASYIQLLNLKWDIVHVAEGNVGITDKEVIDISIKEDRIILTFDSDYGELVYKLGYKPIGVIYYRLQDFTPTDPANITYQLIEKDKITAKGYFTVVDKNQVRQRKI